jgi:hypothetical protein
MGKSDPYIEISKNMPDGSWVVIYSAPEKGEIRFIKFPIGSEITSDIRMNWPVLVVLSSLIHHWTKQIQNWLELKKSCRHLLTTDDVTFRFSYVSQSVVTLSFGCKIIKYPEITSQQRCMILGTYMSNLESNYPMYDFVSGFYG